MTEQEWLACDDPQRLLAFLDGTHPEDCATTQRGQGLSARKRRLFALAVARHGGCGEWVPVGHFLHAAEVMAEGGQHDLSQHEIDAGYGYIASRLVEPNAAEVSRRILAHYEADIEDRETGPAQAALLRDIVGNPFQPRVLGTGTALLACQTVQQLAQTAYDERQADGTLDPQRLAILADALEEAGCTSEEVLRHCRGEEWVPLATDLQHQWGEGRWRPLRGPHVRGCWALDLILGKE